MLRLLSDENFNGDIVRGLLLRRPNLNLLRVQDIGLGEADDPTILEWAAANNRIVLTHDRATMPDFAYARVVAGQPMPGVFVFDDRMPVRQAIEENYCLLRMAANRQSGLASWSICLCKCHLTLAGGENRAEARYWAVGAPGYCLNPMSSGRPADPPDRPRSWSSGAWAS